MAKKLECEIVQDLLPNYVENLTSEYTSERVKEHLDECPPCQSIYEMMKEEPLEQVQQNVEEAKKLRWYMKKFKVMNWLIGGMVAVVIYAGFQFAYYQLTYGVITTVKSNQVDFTELYELENGWIFLTLRTTDLKRNSGFGTNLYLNDLTFSISRTLIPEKAEESDTFDLTSQTFVIDPESGLFVNYSKGKHLINAPELSVLEYVKSYWYRSTLKQQKEKIDEIYFQGRNEDDRVLIWERGMVLPLLDN